MAIVVAIVSLFHLGLAELGEPHSELPFLAPLKRVIKLFSNSLRDTHWSFLTIEFIEKGHTHKSNVNMQI